MGKERKGGGGGFWERRAGVLPAAPTPDYARRCLIRGGLEPGDELGEVPYRQTGPRDDPERRVVELRHRGEILEQVVMNGIGGARRDIARPVPHPPPLALPCPAR